MVKLFAKMQEVWNTYLSQITKTAAEKDMQQVGKHFAILMKLKKAAKN